MAQTKNTHKQPVSSDVSKLRQRKLGRKQKIKAVKSSKKLPSSFRLLTSSLKHLWRHKKLFAGVFVIYLILYIIFVRGLGMNFELGDAKGAIEEALGAEANSFEVAGGLFGVMVGNLGAVSSDAAAVYQSILLVLGSLSIIWLLRATSENRTSVTIKDVMYKSSYPLVPYLLVGFVLLLQSLPALLSLSLYSLIMTNNSEFLGALEQILWTVMLIAGVCISVYFLSSSLFASYIVSLPDMTPRSALRAARKIVKYRRWAIIRKVVFLPVVALIALVVVFLPLIVVAPLLAELLFMFFSLAGLVLMHTYFYTLYRELL